MNLIKNILNFVLFMPLIASTLAMSVEHTTDTEEEIKSNLAHGLAILIDVRELIEWEAGHLNMAKNIPLSDLRSGLGMDNLPRDKILPTQPSLFRSAGD